MIAIVLDRRPDGSVPMVSEVGNQDTSAQPIGIPHRPADSSSDFGDLHNLVGSPEALSSLNSHQTYFSPEIAAPSTLPEATGNRHNVITLDSSPPVSPSRSNLLRSATTPESHTRRRPSSIVHEVTHGLLRLPRGEHPRPKHEWTVFGDLMGDNEQRGSAAASAIANTFRSRDSLREWPSVSSVRGQRVSVSPQVPSVSESPPNEQVVPPSENSRRGSESPSEDLRGPQRGAQSSEPERPSSSSGSESTLKPNTPSARRRWFQMPTIPLLYKNILKCSIAYFIGSLFTFSPYLSGFISDLTGYGPGERTPSPSGHMVATVAVYFNPAKTFGSMFEADTFCLVGLLFATFVSLSSMSMYWFLELKPGWEWLADSLAILWIGAGMSTIAWMKMWMAKPTFNTACSMTCIILFIVVVKEGGLETLLQVAFIVLVGSIISNVVCCVLWPQRATRNLQATMTKTLDSFATLLTMITETFLLEEPLLLVSQEKLLAATANHQGSFTALKKSLAEAQSERFSRQGQGKSGHRRCWRSRRRGKISDAPMKTLSIA
ncbi:hypothetical protein NM688_g6665 [Phlebia brevispora]|uniref:Uncharacterized protein n=1 Tax=Phlebia brevispora TaxID=194682 RepID=A0ACC1SDT1_9APHY|nr:hypothetical protein NM688_g6665 [Phlebia brevispora]